MFDDKNLKEMYTKIWDKIKFVINGVTDNKLSDYNKLNLNLTITYLLVV